MFAKIAEKAFERIQTTFLLLPFLALSISTIRPDFNILDNPLSITAMLGCVGLTFLSYFAYFLYIIAITRVNAIIPEHAFGNFAHIIGCAILAFAIALTIKYLPSKEEFEALSLIKNPNTVRIITLYLLGMETVTIPR